VEILLKIYFVLFKDFYKNLSRVKEIHEENAARRIIFSHSVSGYSHFVSSRFFEQFKINFLSKETLVIGNSTNFTKNRINLKEKNNRS